MWSGVPSAVNGLPTPRFAVKGVVGKPPCRPRLFALDLEDVDGRGAAMQSAVADALGFALDRPFWPHITLVRLRRGAPPRAPAPPPKIEPFAPAALSLYESRAGRYIPLGRRVL